MNFSHEFLLFCMVLACYNLETIWFVQLVVYPLFANILFSQKLDRKSIRPITSSI